MTPPPARPSRVASPVVALLLAALALGGCYWCAGDDDAAAPDAWWMPTTGTTLVATQEVKRDGVASTSRAATAWSFESAGERGCPTRVVVAPVGMADGHLASLRIDDLGTLQSVELGDLADALTAEYAQSADQLSRDLALSPEGAAKAKLRIAMLWLATGAGWVRQLSEDEDVGTGSLVVPVVGGVARVQCTIQRGGEPKAGSTGFVASYSVTGHNARELRPELLRRIRATDDIGERLWAHTTVDVRGTIECHISNDTRRPVSAVWEETTELGLGGETTSSSTEVQSIAFDFREKRESR